MYWQLGRKYDLFLKATSGFEPFCYKGEVVITLLRAIVYVFLHNMLNVLVHIANKMGLQKKSFLGLILSLISQKPQGALQIKWDYKKKSR
jgi:hypothetical protein